MSTARFAPRAVLFDLDGTLLDTIADLADAANLTLAELGRPARSQDEIHSFVGKGIPHLVRRCMTEGTSATEAEIETAVTVFRRHYAVVNGARTTIYPGVIETLQTLLARMEIAHYFDTVVSGDTLAVKKPDPAVVRLACERLEVAPTEALMIGDSANDALAAQGAGIPVLLVTYGYSEGVPVDTIECDGLLSNAVQALDHIAAA